MRYWVKRDTLVIEGKFEALSSGLLGGWKVIDHIFNHTVKGDLDDAARYLRSVAEEFRLKSYFGLLTSVPMDKLAFVECDEVKTFVTAGVENPNAGTINIIVVVNADISDGGMVNAVITATEAKAAALLEKFSFTGTNTDAVIIAKTGKGRYHEYAGPASELGRKIWIAVKRAVKESLAKW
jgi:adenosylcobinamide hydrolase